MAGAAGIPDADRVRRPGPADRDPARAGVHRPAYHRRRARRAMGGVRRPAQLDGGQHRRPVHAVTAAQSRPRPPEPPLRLQPGLAAARPGGGGRRGDRRRGGLRPRPGAGQPRARALPQRHPGQQRSRQLGRRGPGAHPERADRPDRRSCPPAPGPGPPGRRRRPAARSTPQAQATPTAPATDVPTPTDSPSAAPTDSTAPSPTATPTDSPSTSAVSLGSSGIHTVAKVAPASCRSASPSQSS